MICDCSCCERTRRAESSHGKGPYAFELGANVRVLGKGPHAGKVGTLECIRRNTSRVLEYGVKIPFMGGYYFYTSDLLEAT